MSLMTHHSQNKTLQIFLGLAPGILLFFAGSGWAKDRINFDLEPNQSFLRDTQVGLENSDAQLNAALNNRFYGKGLAHRMEQEYFDLNRQYDMRARYGLASPFEQAEQAKRNSDFGRYMLRHSVSYQVTESLQKAEKTSSEVRTFRQAQQTIQSVVQHSSSFKVSNSFKFGTKTDLPAQRGKVWMNSDIVNANFDAQFGRGFSLNPIEKANQTPLDGERMLVSLSRGLGVWDLQCSMTYGVQSTKMNHSITKQLAPNLSAEVATTRGMNPGKSGLSHSEESVRMSYGLKF